jgi:hypothetical protein
MQSSQKVTQKLKLLRSIFCPEKAKFVVAEVSNRFIVPNGQASWLQCEACQGWHVLIDNQPQVISPENSLQLYGALDSSFYEAPLL